MSSIENIIVSRRSVFPPQFSEVKIPDEKVWQLLKMANFAPNHRKTEPWRFRVVTGAHLEKLAAYFQQTFKAHAKKFNESKYEKFRTKILASSHVICICMKRHPDLLPEWEEVAAVSCAVQNLWLAAHEMGYGGYWSSPSLMIRHITDFMPLEEDEHCLGFFYLGVPVEGLPTTGERGDIKDKVIWMD